MLAPKEVHLDYRRPVTDIVEVCKRCEGACAEVKYREMSKAARVVMTRAADNGFLNHVMLVEAVVQDNALTLFKAYFF